MRERTDGRDLVFRPVQEGVLPMARRDPGGSPAETSEGQPRLIFCSHDFLDVDVVTWSPNDNSTRQKVAATIRHYRDCGELWNVLIPNAYSVCNGQLPHWYFRWHNA